MVVLSRDRADIAVDLLPDGRLSLSVPYDLYIKSLIKAIDGRRWHPEQKIWSIPRNGFRNLRELAARANVGIAPTEKVRHAFALGVKFKDELAAAKTDETPFDLSTKTTPFPFQYSGIRFATEALHDFKGALIADDMGLGKTFMALAVVATHERLRDVLVLCPSTLKYVWAAEIEKHFPDLTYTVIEGNAEARRDQWDEDTILKIANYELLVPSHGRKCLGGSEQKREKGGRCDCGSLAKDILMRMTTWDLVISDEVTFLKNYQTLRSRTAKKLRTKYRLALSGIPLENRLEELHSVMDWVIPGLLGPGWLFVQEYCVRNIYGKTVAYRNVEKVRERISPYMIRRRKEDVLTDLPEKVYSDLWLEMTDDEWKLYDTVRAQIREEIKENPKLNASNILVMMLRLKQATGDARLLEAKGIPSSKMMALDDLLNSSGDHRVVAFTQFAGLARLVAEEFDAPLIEGAVSNVKRQKIFDSFQRGEHKMLVSTDAGAYGVTLTAADVIVHLDQPWTPARMRQREDRLHRIGQKSTVQVVNFLCRRTVDEKVRAILHRKSELIKIVLDEETPDADAVQITMDDVMGMLE